MLKIKTQNSTPDVTISGMECSECGKFIGNTKLFAGSPEVFRDGLWKEWMYCPFCGKELGEDVELTQLTKEDSEESKSIKKLERQVSVLEDQMDFYESCIAEMAEVVYE